MVFVCTVLGQADLGAAGAFVPQRGFCRQFHCHAVRGIHRAGTVSSPMSGCCNGRCHVPHIGAAVPPASGTVGPLRVPLFLAMLIPWTWCCQQGIYIELASRTYSNYILCASISVCGIWIFCHLCRELNANNALRPALSFLGRHSLWLFFVHHMDVFTSAIWQKDRLLFTRPAASGGTSCFPCCCLAAGHCCAPAGAG